MLVELTILDLLALSLAYHNRKSATLGKCLSRGASLASGVWNQLRLRFSAPNTSSRQQWQRAVNVRVSDLHEESIQLSVRSSRIRTIFSRVEIEIRVDAAFVGVSERSNGTGVMWSSLGCALRSLVTVA